MRILSVREAWHHPVLRANFCISPTPHIQAIPKVKIKTATSCLCLALVGFIGLLDYQAGAELNLWLLYLAPIALGTMVLGVHTGYALSILCASLLFLNGFLLGNPFHTIFAFLVDRASASTVYIVVTFLTGIARAAMSSSDAQRSSEGAPRLH